MISRYRKYIIVFFSFILTSLYVFGIDGHNDSIEMFFKKNPYKSIDLKKTDDSKSIKKIKNLVLSGGGLDGIAYAGVFKAIEEYYGDDIKYIENICGVSVGSLISTLIAVGYTSEEMINIIKNFDFKKLADQGYIKIPDSIAIINVLNKRGRYGLNSGDYLRDWIDDLIYKKLGIRNATFSDFKKRNLKNLYMFASNLTKQKIVEYSYEVTPNMPIADASRASASYPIMFDCIVGPENDIFIDGGIYAVYPIDFFDKKGFAHDETIGIMVPLLRKNAENFIGALIASENKSVSDIVNTDLDDMAFEQPYITLKDYVGRMLGSTFVVQNFKYKEDDNVKRTIYINTFGINSMNFDINKDERVVLINGGYKSAKDFFAKQK